MASRRQKKIAKGKLARRYEEWITRGTGTAAEYLGMTNEEFEDWMLRDVVPEWMFENNVNNNWRF